MSAPALATGGGRRKRLAESVAVGALGEVQVFSARGQGSYAYATIRRHTRMTLKYIFATDPALLFLTQNLQEQSQAELDLVFAVVAGSVIRMYLLMQHCQPLDGLCEILVSLSHYRLQSPLSAISSDSCLIACRISSDKTVTF